MRRILLPLFVLLLPMSTRACLNDRDTLADETRWFADEVKGMPGVVQVVTGRFPRNPPLFYEMRIKRVAGELQANPSRLDLYDDAGVACDRIGRDDEAIGWMGRKLRYLQRANANDPKIHEHWYRYYANRGTFLAHRWLRAGAHGSAIAQMREAADSIKRATQLKPDAHFGREKYQLKALQWIVNPPPGATGAPLPDFLGLAGMTSANGGAQMIASQGYGDAVKGLTGLVTLGNAWESLDVFYELKTVLAVQDKMTLVYFTNCRIRELIEHGHNSLYPGAPTGTQLAEIAAPAKEYMYMSYPSTDRPEQLQRFYTLARAESEAFQKRRTGYMMQRLKAGRHPDTDPAFWSAWRDAGPPDPAIIHSWWFNNPWAAPFLRSFLVLGLASLVLLWAVRKKRPLAVSV